MSTPRLPNLPIARVRRHFTHCAVFDPTPGRCDCSSLPKVYDANELRAYGLAVWKAAMEQAAKVAKKHASQGPFTGNYGMGYNDASHIIADTLAGLPLPESDMTQARGE